MRISPTFLTTCGIPRIWGRDVEGSWKIMHSTVFPVVSSVIAPNSAAYGATRVPLTGGAVLASNHLSAIDGLLIGTFSRRAIWFMMKSELAELPLLGEILMWTGGFPVCRDKCSPESIRNARRLVQAEHVVGVFPEGTRQRFGYPADNYRGGAAAIALRERVPVIPCGIESFRWSLKNRRPCCVVFGEEIDFSDIDATPSGYRLATRILRHEIVRLWRQASEAARAGFPLALKDGTPRDRPVRASEFARVVHDYARVSGHPRDDPGRHVYDGKDVDAGTNTSPTPASFRFGQASLSPLRNLDSTSNEPDPETSAYETPKSRIAEKRKLSVSSSVTPSIFGGLL